MKQTRALEQLQRIADAKSDLALGRLAEANAQIASLQDEKRNLAGRLSQLSQAATAPVEFEALEKFRVWTYFQNTSLDGKIDLLQQKAAQLKEVARQDFGKAQAIRKLRSR